MKLGITKTLVTIALIGLFSQFSLAQDDSALSTIAGIVANLNHFPSDDDKATLMAISEGDGERRGIVMLANAVGNIAHSANDEGKEEMNRLIASDMAPANVKAVAEIVLGFMHSVNDEAKATLAGI